VTEAGKLKTDYLDVDNLVATQAQSKNYAAGVSGWRLMQNGNAEFASSVIIGGLGSLAKKDSVTYSEVTGTKPPTNADNTGTNTSANTNAVAGAAATTVRDWSYSGAVSAGTVNNWTRPGQTLIDGNKIFTGDAYVDTLQIKGNAVTVPAGARRTSFVQIPSTLAAG